MFDTSQHFIIDTVDEDQIRAWVHRMEQRVYDPLSKRERFTVYHVALIQARAIKQFMDLQGGGAPRAI